MLDRADQADLLEQMRSFLLSRGSAFFHNAVYKPDVTCSVCATPVDGYRRCYRCNDHVRSAEGLADRVGALTYAIEGTQSHYVMRQYKAATPVLEHEMLVASLAWIALKDHAACLHSIAGSQVTHWATVPSLSPRNSEHPLHKLVKEGAPGSEVLLTPKVSSAPRELDASHYISDALPGAAHVVLIDDTWASGGHAQSAALSLRAAGAAQISLLILARYLRPSFGNNAEFIRDELRSDYSLAVCPWTGSACH